MNVPLTPLLRAQYDSHKRLGWYRHEVTAFTG